jgi:thioredoxin reductase
MAVVQVFIVHRRDEFRASKVMQKRALEHEKIKVGPAARDSVA